jgi:cbb3-type cytochrome oxidase cytochrome c subunit
VRPIQHVTTGELTGALPGAASIARGKQLVVDRGCLGCHKYRGRGGELGPDITYVGNKTVHNLDFKHIPPGTERTVAGWLFAHFKSPQAVIPNSLMPELDLSDEQAADLTAYGSASSVSPPRRLHTTAQLVDATPVR